MDDDPAGGAVNATSHVYVVVLSARSAARFRPEEGQEFFIHPVRHCDGIRNYDQLPEEIRSKAPLRRVWMLAD